MVDRVLLGDIDGTDFGLLVSKSGVDVKTADLNQLIFDSRNTVNSLPIYKIFDVTVSAGSGSPRTPGSYTTTHTSGGLGYIPFVLGFWKTTSSNFEGDNWLLIDSIDGSPSTPSESGFVWAVTDTNLTVYNYYTSQQTFRIVLFKLDVSGGASGASLTAPSLSETSGYRSDRGWIIDWTGVSGATGYRLDIATDAGFTSFPTLDQTYNNYLVSGGGTTSRTVESASATTDYYIRVRADDGTDTGPDSNIIGLQTDSTVAPVVNHPASNTVYQDGSTYTPSFSISNGGVGCDVSFSTSNGGTAPTSIIDVQEGTTISSKTFFSIQRYNGSPTTCSITATIGANSDTENINIYRPDVELGSTISVSDSEVTPTNAYAGVRLTSDGRIRTSTSGSYSNLRDYVSPQNSSAAGLYQARVTSISGTTPSGSSTGSWVNLSSTRTWYIQRTTNTAGTTSSGFTLQVRPAGGSILDSVSVSLSAEVLSTPASIDLTSVDGNTLDVDTIELNSSAFAFASVGFETDGTVITSDSTGDIIAGDFDGSEEWWDAAPDAGAGTGKYIRVETVSGDTPSSAALNTWVEITVGRDINLSASQSGSGTTAKSSTVDIWVNTSTSKTGAETARITLRATAQVF